MWNVISNISHLNSAIFFSSSCYERLDADTELIGEW